MAFAVTTDHARQSAVWAAVSQQGYRPGAWQIKRLLTEDRVLATSAIARFVGIEAYEAAGGQIDRDLFAEEDERGIWFDDPDLLNKLAMDSLQAAARELETRWKWAEARLDVDWSATAAFGRVRPQPAEPTDEEKAEIERLRTRNDELANMDDDGWTEELVEEADANETRLDEIEAMIEARAVYRREDIAIAGCIATVGNDGELKLIQGLVRPEDMPARESGEADAAGHDAAGDEENTISGIDAPTFVAPLASPGDAEAEARKEAGVGIGLADDLRAIRTAIVKSQLACDFEAAFDLLLFQLARGVFTTGYHDDALDIRAAETPDRPAMRVNDDAFGTVNVGEKHLEIDRAAQKLDWTGLSDAEAFAELRALPERDKRTLFASCVARTLKGQLAFEPKARPEVEATVARLDIDFAAAVRGNRDQVWTADLLWSRLRKDRILAIARGRWARPGRKRRPSRRRRTSPRRCRTPSPTATASPPGSRPRAAPRPSPGRRRASAPSIPAPSTTAVRQMTRGQPPPNRNRLWQTRRWAMRRKMMAMTPTADPSGVEAETSQAGDPEASAPADNDADPVPVEAQQPMNARVHSVVESIDAPAVAERRAAALASAKNSDAAPTSESAPEAIDPPAGDAGPADHDGVRITIAGGGHDVSVEPEQVMAPPARQRPRQQSGVAGDSGLPAPRLNHRVLPSRQRPAGTVRRGVFHSRIDNQENPHVYPTECRYGRGRQWFRHDPRPGRRQRHRQGDPAVFGWPCRYFHRDAAKLTPWRGQPRCRNHRAGRRYHPRYPRRRRRRDRRSRRPADLRREQLESRHRRGGGSRRVRASRPLAPGLHPALACPRPGPKPRLPPGAGARSLPWPRCGACRPGRQRPLAPWNRGHLRGVRGAPRGPRFP